MLVIVSVTEMDILVLMFRSDGNDNDDDDLLLCEQSLLLPW